MMLKRHIVDMAILAMRSLAYMLVNIVTVAVHSK